MNSIYKHAILIFGLIFFFGLSFNPAFAQIKAEKVSKKAVKLYEESQSHLKWDRFKEAKMLLVEAISISSEFTDALYLKADIEIFNQQYLEAEKSLTTLSEIDPTFSNRTNFLMGEALFFQEKYAASKPFYESYLEKTKS